MAKRYTPRDTSWSGKSLRTGLYREDGRIKTLEVRVTQTIMGDTKRETSQYFKKDDCPTLLGCANTECPFGAHDLRHEIEDMIRQSETERAVSFYCAKKEGTPAGARMYSRSCLWSAKGIIKIEYPPKEGDHVRA